MLDGMGLQMFGDTAGILLSVKRGRGRVGSVAAVQYGQGS